MFFLKVLRLGGFGFQGPVYSIQWWLTEKKVFLKKLCLTLKRGILFMFLVDYGLVNIGIILIRYFGDWLPKLL